MTSSRRSLRNAFASLALDRASERREDAAWLAACARSPNARYLVLRPDGGALVTPDRAGLRELAPAAPASFLGRAADGDHFLLTVDDTAAARIAAAADGVFLDLRSAGAWLPAFAAGLFAYARGLAHWQRHTRYCTACAAPLALEAAGHRARCTDPRCALEHFPRTDPAIIVIVGHGERCLLGRQPQWPAHRYSTLAGFVEPGEALEDAVRREVFRSEE